MKTIKKALKALLGVALFLLVFGGLGFGMGHYLHTTTGAIGTLWVLYGLAMFYLSVPLQTVLHEAGHLVGGLLSGYRFLSFNVFGFVWARGDDGHVRFGRSVLAGAAGQCLMGPPDYDEGRFPFTLYNMGGVLANLLCSAAGVLLCILCRPLPALFLLFAANAFTGLFFAATNGLPISTAAIQNDGRNQLCAMRSPAGRLALWRQLAVAAQMVRGVRLKDMPNDLFAPFPEADMHNPLVTTMAVNRCNRLMDALDFPAAEAAIRDLFFRKDGVMPLHRMLLACDGAVCELLANRPGALTAALSAKDNKQLMQAMRTNPGVLRTQYALALLRDRDAKKAAGCLAAFEKATKSHPYPQDILSERAIIAAIDAAEEDVAP